MKRNIALLLAICMLACALAGCGNQADGKDAANGSEKVFTYGTTGYGVEMGDAGLNPHENYSGWSAVRYGVCETLFKFSDSMEPDPWLATSYTFLDENTVKITLRENVRFSSGRLMDGAAVKECLDHLLAVHDRAPSDLKIDHIDADGQAITITTTEPTPAIINYLCDPYGAIIDMEYGITDDNNVAGTGPYKAIAVSDTEITLVKNENYWGGTVNVDKVIVKSITDGDTLTLALRSGEIDATYGLPYASYSQFENDNYTISSCATSRAFFGQMNYASAVLQDQNVRKAIACAIDKDSFVKTLLNGHGAAATGAFPSSFAYGNETVTTEPYNTEKAKSLLEESGWTDTDGDGYVDKDGQKLTIRWLTYPGRQELPLLAESVQATLKNIGIAVDINCTANHLDIVSDPTAWDIYASALVTAPTGDPEYFFTTCCLASSAKNRGNYNNAALEELAEKLHTTFDTDERAQLATQMQQILLDDNAYVFASHLQMSIVSKRNVTGMVAHPCDYYEITADLNIS